MLTSIVYSCISTHDSREVNFYILDFGAETMTMFRNAPHVGEVILSADGEKVANLFKMITGIIEERKKIFIDYNGSFDFYINHGGRQIPLIVIMINNVEAFLETYPDYEELIGQMTRDCLKYGVVFIFSTNGPNTVRYRLRQNFGQNVVLQFNDPMDYASVIPGVRKKEPSKVFGRGLILLNSIFEFQTAYAYKEEKLTDYVKIVCDKLRTICDYKAQRIPILPEVVNQEVVKDYIGRIENVPLGVEKESLEMATVNLKDKYIYNITGEDITAEPAFIKGVIRNLTQVKPNTEVVVLDAISLLNDYNIPNVVYSKESCYDGIDYLTKAFETNDQSKMTFAVVVGINNLLNKLSAIEKGKFTTLIADGKNNGNIKYIIVDTIDTIKSINFETWYKPNVDLSEGVWIGNGIGNQFTLKVTTNSRVLRQEVAPGFGYSIRKGKAALMKLMSDE